MVAAMQPANPRSWPLSVHVNAEPPRKTIPLPTAHQLANPRQVVPLLGGEWVARADLDGVGGDVSRPRSGRLGERSRPLRGGDHGGNRRRQQDQRQGQAGRVVADPTQGAAARELRGAISVVHGYHVLRR